MKWLEESIGLVQASLHIADLEQRELIHATGIFGYKDLEHKLCGISTRLRAAQQHLGAIIAEATKDTPK